MAKKIYTLYYAHEDQLELIGIFDNVDSYLNVMNHWAAKDPYAYQRGDGWIIKENEINTLSSDAKETLKTFGLEEI